MAIEQVHQLADQTLMAQIMATLTMGPQIMETDPGP